MGGEKSKDMERHHLPIFTLVGRYSSQGDAALAFLLRVGDSPYLENLRVVGWSKHILL